MRLTCTVFVSVYVRSDKAILVQCTVWDGLFNRNTECEPYITLLVVSRRHYSDAFNTINV